MKAIVLNAVSVLGLTICTASATGLSFPDGSFIDRSMTFPTHKGVKTLYSQNSNYAGDAVNSQNFTDGTFSAYDDQAADDFVVPSGQVWRITEVDVSGQYYNNTTSASSENVIFYKNKNGAPGRAVTNGTFVNLSGDGSGGNFAIALPGRGLRLKPGRYWVSVVINMGFYEQGDLWGWNTNTGTYGKPAMWQNPSGGFGYCQTWCTIKSLGFSGPDLMFDLLGNSKST